TIGDRIVDAPIPPILGGFGVNTQVMDGKGYLWLGTNNGLIRFDGKEQVLHEMQRDSINSLPGNMIFALEALPGERLLIHTGRGLAHFDQRTMTFTRLLLGNQGNNSRKEVHFAPAPFGGDLRILWDSTAWYQYHISSPKSQPKLLVPGLLPEQIRYAFQLPGGDFLLWSATHGYRVNSLSGKVQPTSPPPPSLFHGKDAPQGQLYLPETAQWLISTQYGKIYIFDANWQLNPISQAYSAIDFGKINALSIGGDGALWIGALSGLYHAKLPLSGPPNTLRDDMNVYSIFTKPDLGMWFGTTSGWKTIPPLAFQFHLLQVFPAQKSAQPPLWGLSLDKQQNLWIGSYGGVIRIPIPNFPKTGKPQFFPKPGAPSNLTSILHFKNEYYVGAPTGIFRLDTSNSHYQKLEIDRKGIPKPGSDYTFVLENLQDSLIIAANSGSIFAFDPIKLALQNILPRGNTTAAAVHRDAQGRMWMADAQLAIYPENTALQPLLDSLWAAEKMDGTEVVFTIWKQGETHLFVGSTDGVLWLDLQAKTIQRIDRNAGLPSNRVMGILGSENGTVWMASENGISRLETETGNMQHYAQADGVPANDFNQFSFLKHPKGYLMFGCAKGITWFHPDSILLTEKALQVQFQDILINHKSILGNAEKGLNHDLAGLKQLDLFPGEGALSIAYAALNFRRPEATEYGIKMEGLDEDWQIRRAGERVVYYSRLSSGNYTFRVKARLPGNNWGPEKQFQIVVHPPLYEQLWFRLLLAGGALLLFGLLLYVYFRRKLQRQQAQMAAQARLFAERERISRDLHDHVGSGLTALSMGLQNLGRKVPETDAAKEWREKVTSIEDLTRRVIVQLRDTVWALDTQDVSLQNFRRKLHGFLSEFVVTSGLETEWEITCNQPSFQLEANFALELYRMVQEGIHNALRHAAPELVRIDIQITETRELILLLEDDGKGFVVDELMNNPQDGHYGLRNLQARTEALKGEIEITSEVGKGSRLQWKFQI
ncbi:MAG TPA: hypothetical protein ENJ82_15935, partial [Bacteroidetes bacterium]|nr:hypothetical protein [Bacteroidota bacterium]